MAAASPSAAASKAPPPPQPATPQPVIVRPEAPKPASTPVRPPPGEPPPAAAAPAPKKHRVLRVALIVAGVIVAGFAALVVLALLFGNGTNSASRSGDTAWTLQAGSGQNLYAIAIPAKATLNLKTIVLACEIIDGARVLHLQLYPNSAGPLVPNGASRAQLRDEPHARIEIDGAVFGAKIYFAGEFAVVADQVTGGHPVLTPALGAKIEKGRELTLRLDLLRDQSSATPFDAYAVVAIDGSKPIATVRRRCGQ